LPTRNLNIRANTNPGTVGSVRFDLDGVTGYAIENAAPYALAGDSSANYNRWTPSVGSHALTGTPFAGAGASSTSGTAVTLLFSVQP
jgi:hypothetical protein